MSPAIETVNLEVLLVVWIQGIRIEGMKEKGEGQAAVKFFLDRSTEASDAGTTWPEIIGDVAAAFFSRVLKPFNTTLPKSIH